MQAIIKRKIAYYKRNFNLMIYAVCNQDDQFYFEYRLLENAAKKLAQLYNGKYQIISHAPGEKTVELYKDGKVFYEVTVKA